MVMSRVLCLITICLLDPMSKVSGTQSKVVDDVTTIYNLLPNPNPNEGALYNGIPIEIHVRTNALGLLPKTEFGFLEPENKVDDDLLCFQRFSWEERKCGWTSKGFTWEDVSDDSVDIGYLGDRSSKFKTQIRVKLCEYISDFLTNYNYCRLYIKPSNSNEYFYKLEVVGRCRGCTTSTHLYSCRSTLYEPNNFADAHCDVVATSSSNIDVGKILKLKITDQNFQVFNQYESSLYFNEEVSFLNSTWKVIETDLGRGVSAARFYDSNVLRSQEADSTLTSPPVVIPKGELCLQVVFHTVFDGDLDQLSVSVVDKFQQQLTSDIIHTNKSGWHYWKMEETFSEHLQEDAVSIVLTTLTRGEIDIHRISSCKNEDNGEVSVITPEMLKERGIKDAFTKGNGKSYFVSSKPEKLETDGENIHGEVCLNGGVFTDAGCACAAGFTGPKCSHACGPNRFGQDCGGKCSVYSDGCKGLLLCTPGAGCHCAPGYEGSHCDEECGRNTPDRYGVDCRQQCGHCVGSCNRYSGHCSECSSGYYPPMCQEKYIHLKSAPLVSSPEYGTLKVFINFTSENLEGSGDPIFYRVQYKLNKFHEWKNYTTLYLPKDKEIAEMVMGDLEDATEYVIRVLLLADDYNCYQEEDVPSALVYTKCDIPESYDYAISVVSDINNNKKNSRVSWSYILKDHWCPIVFYEVWWKERWQWKNKAVKNNYHEFHDILTDEDIVFKVRAKTIGGYTPFSNTGTVVGLYDDKGSQQVVNLKAVSTQRNTAEVSWEPPLYLSYPGINYHISYKCLMFPSCSTPCNSSGALTTTKTAVTLGPLLPAAQYKVSVAPDFGPKAFLQFRTLEAAQEEIPRVSDKRIVRTNSTATVFWEPVEVCTGFFNTYYYRLFLATDSSKNTIESGQTRNTSATFNNLLASTDYVVQVSVMSTGGWDPSKYLTIDLATSATVPEPVRNLTVYKRGRNLVGLRWAEPRALYGALESFTVTYSQGIEEKSATVQPTPCVPWPHLYCHTVTGLKPARTYNFTIKARNTEIHEDGAAASVIGPTRENTPGAPENLSVVNVTSTSLGLQWEHPSLVNGILRSFLVSVEETEQYDQDQCCQIYPIIEVAVTDEQRDFQLEVSGLHPASMYTVSVSGKTVGFGPSQTVTAATRPPVIPIRLPHVSVPNKEVKWLPQSRQQEVNNTQVYSMLVKSHILLVITNHTDVATGIEDERLNTLLKADISAPFYFATEYAEGDTVTVGAGEEGDSQWGHFSNPPLEDEESYQLAAVL